MLNKKIDEPMGVFGSQSRGHISRADTCVIASSIPAGVTVPLHSHIERETFYIVSGSLEVFDKTGWRTLSGGNTFDMPPESEHAFRNISGDPVSVALVVPTKVVEFFASIGRPICILPLGSPSPEALREFVSAAVEHGYWLGTSKVDMTAGISRFLTAMEQADRSEISRSRWFRTGKRDS